MEVALGSATNGATIRDTTDGTDPDESSPIDGAAVHLTVTTTLKVQASKDGLAPSDIASALSIVDPTKRVSVKSNSAEFRGTSSDPSISADGRFAAFYSQGTNRVPGDTNGESDIFDRDRGG